MSEIICIGDDQPFALRLAETIDWCEGRLNLADPQRSLRSIELQPLLLARNRITVVHFLALKRHSLLTTKRISPITSSEDLRGGKLLCYFPDEEVWDGASQLASFGFFDDHDAPAWDTWVGLFEEDRRGLYLISWVPAELIAIAEQGLAVNAVECISWLEQTDLKLKRELTELGLINRGQTWWK